MPFIEMDGVDGFVYVPEEVPNAAKKHPCPDCENCQHCADSRCNICLRTKCPARTGNAKTTHNPRRRHRR